VQRSDERESESTVDDLLDDAAGVDEAAPDADRSADADEPRIGVEGRYFSGKALGVALLALLAGAFVGGLVPIVGGTLGRAVGLFAGAFAVGLLLPRRRYVETGLAGIGVGAASALFGVLTVGFLPIGVDFLAEYGVGATAVGAVVGLLVSLLGHYFGRDLRAGLTAEL